MKDGTPIEPGVYYDMPEEQYREAEGLSTSSMKRLLKKPLDYIDRYRRPNLYPPSRALVFGRSLHCALLEPDRFEQDWPTYPNITKQSNAGLDALVEFYCIHGGVDYGDVVAGIIDDYGIKDTDIDKNVGKKAAVKWLEENRPVEALTPDEAETLRYMQESWNLPEHSAVRNLFTGTAHNEVSIFWRDPDSGIMLKARLDRVVHLDNGLISVPDLKSTKDASGAAFSKAIPNYGYDLQASVYTEAVKAHYAQARDNGVRFIFAVIEKNPPFGAAAYIFNDPVDLETGYRKMRVAITLYQQCIETGEWPSYPNVIQPISMPGWAKSD